MDTAEEIKLNKTHLLQMQFDLDRFYHTLNMQPIQSPFNEVTKYAEKIKDTDKTS